jgi:site-specific DNA-cytosine methylase
MKVVCALVQQLGANCFLAGPRDHRAPDLRVGSPEAQREAARLQSFPDGFMFCGTMNPAFRQIGNAVPPLMAQALAQKIMATFKASDSKGNHVFCETAAAI